MASIHRPVASHPAILSAPHSSHCTHLQHHAYSPHPHFFFWQASPPHRAPSPSQKAWELSYHRAVHPTRLGLLNSLWAKHVNRPRIARLASLLLRLSFVQSCADCIDSGPPAQLRTTRPSCRRIGCCTSFSATIPLQLLALLPAAPLSPPPHALVAPPRLITSSPIHLDPPPSSLYKPRFGATAALNQRQDPVSGRLASLHQPLPPPRLPFLARPFRLPTVASGPRLPSSAQPSSLFCFYARIHLHGPPHPIHLRRASDLQHGASSESSCGSSTHLLALLALLALEPTLMHRMRVSITTRL